MAGTGLTVGIITEQKMVLPMADKESMEKNINLIMEKCF